MSSQSRSTARKGRWTREEHEAFLQGLKLYGREWRSVQALVGTRSPSQIRSHAQKYFARSNAEQAGGRKQEPGCCCCCSCGVEKKGLLPRSMPSILREKRSLQSRACEKGKQGGKRCSCEEDDCRKRMCADNLNDQLPPLFTVHRRSREGSSCSSEQFMVVKRTESFHSGLPGEEDLVEGSSSSSWSWRSSSSTGAASTTTSSSREDATHAVSSASIERFSPSLMMETKTVPQPAPSASTCCYVQQEEQETHVRYTTKEEQQSPSSRMALVSAITGMLALTASAPARPDPQYY